MTAPSITPLPTPPSRSQAPASFSADADAFLAALPAFQSEANAQADYLDTLAVDVTNETGADVIAAAASASAALASENAAAGSESAALASQNAAASSADNAANSASQAAATYDEFDDRYLGSKTSNPTLDNDGNPLIEGALYWNSVSNQMRVYDGAAWVATFLPEGAYVQGAPSSVDGGLVAFDGATGKLIKAGPAPSTAGNVLTSDGTNWTSAAPPPSGPSLDAIASGTLADGSTVIVNADGTVSVVAGQQESVGVNATVGSSATTPSFAATYDANSQKIVIINRDSSGFGRATVGTVTGTSINFGIQTVFYSDAMEIVCATYDANAQKVVVAFRAQNELQGGRLIVGAVSGTNISFGSQASFAGNQVKGISITYAATEQKVVIAYGNDSRGYVRVCTVSGTSISVGARVQFRASFVDNTSIAYDADAQKVVITSIFNANHAVIVGAISGTSISFGSEVALTTSAETSAIYDASAQKVVVAYRVNSASTGEAIVGTVSGTSISFGSPVQFATAIASLASSNMFITYDSRAQKVVIAYRRSPDNFGTVSTGQVSGTSISFEPPTVFRSNVIEAICATYDSDQQKVVVAYRSVTAQSNVIQTPFTNMTPDNFIGFSDGGYTDGQTAKIQLVGSVDDAQTGLTPGQPYYVQLDGSLGLTPASPSPSVFAGTAVAANKIIVKG